MHKRHNNWEGISRFLSKIMPSDILLTYGARKYILLLSYVIQEKLHEYRAVIKQRAIDYPQTHA